MIVADSNLIAYLLIPGDKSTESERLLLLAQQLKAPLVTHDAAVRKLFPLFARAPSEV